MNSMFDFIAEGGKCYYKMGQLFCIAKWGNWYYKVRQVLQSGPIIAKWGSVDYLMIDIFPEAALQRCS